ncbi:MAG: EI24 domain-containing protein [Rhodoferax sp.]
MLQPMTALLSAFFRAALDCLHPRVLLLSLAPLAIMALLAALGAWVFWADAVQAVADFLNAWSPPFASGSWLGVLGFESWANRLAPLLVILLATPVIVILALFVVALALTPALTRWVAARRFADLHRLHGGSFWSSLAWSTGSTALALVALVVSMPLWLIPPLVLVLPPLIWGWLTTRVMAFDTLAEHASASEREHILRTHKLNLLLIGVVSGYLGAAPGLIWATGVFFVALAPLLIALAVWLYTLVFALSSLWFAHYCLAALQTLRQPVAPRPAPTPLRESDLFYDNDRII